MPTSFESQRARSLENLDGFRVEIYPDRERADIILDRPPLNVIEIPQCDQLRLVFEELDHDDRVRVIVLRAEGKHFSSGGNIVGFLAATPEHVSELANNIAAPARCHNPWWRRLGTIVSALASSSPWLAIFASVLRRRNLPCLNSASGKIPSQAVPSGCCT